LLSAATVEKHRTAFPECCTYESRGASDERLCPRSRMAAAPL
jgi:hypothetical protein